MRTLALFGAAAIAIVVASGPVWAWSSDQSVPQGATGTNFADPDEALEALQNKVDSKNGDQNKSGFFISGGASQSPGSPFGFQSSTPNGEVPFGYSPMPGFRAR